MSEDCFIIADAGAPQSDFYRSLMPYTRGGSLTAVFNCRDEDLHKHLKSPIAPIFSVSNIVSFEIYVDQVLKVLCEQIDHRFAQTQKSCNLTDYLQYFAFDVMGTLTFSKRYGFIEAGKDINGMLGTIWTFMKRAAPVSC